MFWRYQISATWREKWKIATNQYLLPKTTPRILLPRIPGTRTTGSRRLKTLERDHIIEVLEDTYWKVAGKGGAAELLDMKPSTLRSRMEKLGIKKRGKRL